MGHEAKVCMQTIALGKNRFKTDGKSWWVMVWGWHGPDQGAPTYRFTPIPTEKVPSEVKDLA